MLEAIRTFCGQYFGWVNWDAVSGLGALMALVWAILLSMQQNNDQRRREQALVKAILVTIDLAAENARIIDDKLRWSWAYLEEVLPPEEYDRRRLEVLKSTNSLFVADMVESTILRLDAIKVTDIPSSRIITNMLSLLVRLRNIHEQLLKMPTNEHDPMHLHSEFSMFELLVASMASIAGKMGVRAEDGDSDFLKKNLRAHSRYAQIFRIVSAPINWLNHAFRTALPISKPDPLQRQ